MEAVARYAPRYTQINDETLIALVASGEQRAYTILVERYSRLVQSVLSRYLTDPEAVKEVMQDAFVRAFRALPSFRGESKFSTWLCKIAISLAITRLKVRRYAAWDSLDTYRQTAPEGFHDNEAALERQDTSRMLQQAIEQLNPQDAAALELFYFREHSIEEICRLTGWTVAKTKSRLSRARVRLRTVLENGGMTEAAAW